MQHKTIFRFVLFTIPVVRLDKCTNQCSHLKASKNAFTIIYKQHTNIIA